MKPIITHGSLFSGIGGFDLAAEWAGWENIFHCEINPFGQKVLKYYWPKAISYDDITKTDFTIHRGTIDVLTGGFPCQPFSLAGKRLGTEDHQKVRKFLNENDLGFSKDRELDKVELIADSYRYTDVGCLLHL